jgi:hypothetical protein
VYNNTIVTTGRQAAFIHAGDVEVTLRNNIFLSGKEGLPFRIDGVTNQSAVRLLHNLYWRGGAPFLVRWGERDMQSLERLQAEVNQEILHGEKLGAFVDPRIDHPSQAGAPFKSFLGLTELKPDVAFARFRGRSLAGLISGPIRDFLGHELQPNGPIPFGAIGGN